MTTTNTLVIDCTHDDYGSQYIVTIVITIMIFDRMVFVDKWYAANYFEIVLKRSLSALHRQVDLISNVNHQTKSKTFLVLLQLQSTCLGSYFIRHS